MVCIDCKKYADEILEQVKQIPNKQKSLVILTAGDNPASAAYMRGKMTDCERCGIPVKQIKVDSYDEMILQIGGANARVDVGGIIVQLPLPKGFNEDCAVSLVVRSKDVDGFRADSPFAPCTPEGIMYVLEKELRELAGREVLLIGKGKLVGRPLIDMLLDRGCTLTIAHSKTLDLEEIMYGRAWNAVITAVGKPRLVDLKYINADVVIDAGISRDENGKLCGDCYNFEDTGWGMKVTTVPGGIGLMTRAMLMKHVGEVNGNG